MRQILAFHKYYEKELSVFYYILSLLGIIGNAIDIFTLYWSHPNYELFLNVLTIMIISLSCGLYFTKNIVLKTGFTISLYAIYLNLVFSNFTCIHEQYHEFFLLRETIFMGFLVTAAFLFISQKHGFILGLTYLCYYSYAVFDSKSQFLLTNLYILFIVFISYILTLNLFYKFNNRSILKIQEDALVIKNQNEELKCINNELHETQKQINAQHEELLALSESLYQQNEELVTRNKMLEDAIHEKTKFFSIVAHDLKSPVSSLTSLTEQILVDYDSMSEDKKKLWLGKSLSSTRMVYELLENLLTWSRSQTGMLHVNPELMALDETIDKIIGIYRTYASNKSVQLTKKADNITLCGDRMMIETILRNLVSNAIKYSHHNGVVSIFAEKEENLVIVSVKDNGVGIPNEHRKKLFSNSYFFTTPGTSGEKGTGLGLWICKEFVEKHNGKIWVENETDKGTVIKFSMPVA